MTELTETLAVVFAYGTRVVGGIAPEQLGLPTPCRDWDIEALLTHMCAVIEGFGTAVSGQSVTPLADYRLGPDFHSQYGIETTRTLAAWKQCDLAGTIGLGGGSMPAEVGLRINALDTSTHLWDLARATGNDERLPDRVAETILEVAHTVVTDEGRSAVGFDAAIPVGPDAGATERLVAFLGRQP